MRRNFVSTKLLLASAVATLIGIPGAMASYNFVTLIDPNSSGFTLASGINDGGPARTLAIRCRLAGRRSAMIECIFGWGKQHGTLRKTKHRGIRCIAGDFLVRIPKLIPA
jgi:hypothetical protein